LELTSFDPARGRFLLVDSWVDEEGEHRVSMYRFRDIVDAAVFKTLLLDDYKRWAPASTVEVYDLMTNAGFADMDDLRSELDRLAGDEETK